MEQPNNKQKEASHISLRSILGGEILVHSFLRRQVYLLILIVILTILYIDNRYSSQQELIEIDRLKNGKKPAVTHRRIYFGRGQTTANSSYPTLFNQGRRIKVQLWHRDKKTYYHVLPSFCS